MTRRSRANAESTLASETFIGRSDDLAHLITLLTARVTPAASRVVTLTGVGGVGKTHLALAAAAAVRPRDGVVVVDLTRYQRPELVAQAIADALGPSSQTKPSMLESLATYLADKRMLLLLDNGEHLIEAVAAAVDTLRKAAAHLRILVTSREPLNIRGEHVMPVNPMNTADATQLLVSRVVAAGHPDFATTDPALLTQLVTRLDRLPLAIMLAAPQLRTLPIEVMMSGLSPATLTGGPRDDIAQHHSMPACIDWSYDLCTPAAQQLWQRISVFAGPCRFDDVVAVCADRPGGDDIGGEPIHQLVDELVTRSVLLQHRIPSTDALAHGGGGAAGPRYFLLDVMRQSARDRLDNHPDDASKWRSRHARHYVAHAHTAHRERFSSQEDLVVAEVRAAMPEYRAALDWLLAGTPCQAAVALTVALDLAHSTAWFAASIAEGSDYLRRALQRAGDSAAVYDRVRATQQLAWHGILQRTSDIEQWTERCRAEALTADANGESHEAPPLAFWHLARGLNDLLVARDPSAMTHLGSAMDGFHDTAPVQYHLATLYLAMAGVQFDDLATAERASRACVTNAEHGGQHAQSWAGWIRGWVLLEQGHAGQAADLFRRSLRAHRRMGTYWGLEWLVASLAQCAALEGDHEPAAQMLGAAKRLRSVAGNDASGLWAYSDPIVIAEDIVTTHLSAETYAAAVEAGETLSYDAAIAVALGEPVPTGDTTPPAQPDHATIAAPSESALALLTPAQLQVARLIAQGLSNAEVATRLRVEKKTVEQHIRHIFRELGLDSATGRVMVTRLVLDADSGLSTGQ